MITSSEYSAATAARDTQPGWQNVEPLVPLFGAALLDEVAA
jgi:hypothetical protein